MDKNLMQQVWIYLDEGDHRRGRSVASQIIDTLRTAGCPGATILRGIGGYGVHGLVHSDLVIDIPSHLPLIITFIDRADRVASVLPALRELLPEGLIALNTVEVIQHSQRVTGPFPQYLNVADVMSRDVASVTATTPVADLVRLLIDRALRCLPVVDADQRVIGIITDGDLLLRGRMTLPLRLQQLLPPSERETHMAALIEQPERAADLMTAHPITLSAKTPLAQAAATMAQHKLKRMPVVDQAGRLLGIVSRSDLLKTVAAASQHDPEHELQPMTDTATKVSSLMITDVSTVYPDTSLAETLDRLIETPKRRVFVVDKQQHVLGIITDGDILRRAAQSEHASVIQKLLGLFGSSTRPDGLELITQGRTAAQLMSSPVISVTSETSPAEAVRLMMTHAIKRLPVVDEQGHLLGLVGRAALLRALQDERPGGDNR